MILKEPNTKTLSEELLILWLIQYETLSCPVVKHLSELALHCLLKRRKHLKYRYSLIVLLFCNTH